MIQIHGNAMMQQSRVPVPVPSRTNYRAPLQPQSPAAINMYRNPTPENYNYDGEIHPYPLYSVFEKSIPGFIVNEN